MAVFLLGLFDSAKDLATKGLRFLGTLNIWQLGCIALALLALVQHFELAAAHRHSRKVEAHDAEATRRLNMSLQNETVLRAAIAKQNAAVRALSVESKRQQDEAVKAQSAAKERVKAAQGQSDRSAASARDPARQKAPCEPSAELKGAWK